MNIDDLLNKYFEGETTFEEERRLRAFFASEHVPQRLAIYKPMFAYFDEELRKRQAAQEKAKGAKARKLWFGLSAAAACVLLLFGLKLAFFTADPCLCSGNYVVINGRCYTDMDKVKASAFDALQEVATPAGDYIPGDELRGLFDDDE